MQTASCTKQPRYERRRPELTPCYKVLQNHLASFLADREAEGRPLPEYVEKEFEAYLRCGIPAHGFIRLKCDSCSEEKIVAFSCKKRGFCPSCCAKRMIEAADHLTENLLPYIPYRQFVITFPIPMRYSTPQSYALRGPHYWLQANKKLYSKIHAIIIKQIHRYYTDKAKEDGYKDSTPGTISFTQRWGSALNLNPHMHVLAADGVYTKNNDDKPVFRNLEKITNTELEELLKNITTKVLSYLKKQGYLDKNGELTRHPEADDLFEDHESLRDLTQASIKGKIAFGENAGKYVTKIGSGFGFGEEIPLAKGRLCYSMNGFSIHAATHINTHAREKLHKLIQYIARGPLSNKRLEILPDERVKLQLKTP